MNLVTNAPHNQNLVADAGAVLPLVMLLSFGGTPAAKEQAAAALGNLALGNAAIRKSVVAAQACPPLLEMLKSSKEKKDDKVRHPPPRATPPTPRATPPRHPPCALSRAISRAISRVEKASPPNSPRSPPISQGAKKLSGSLGKVTAGGPAEAANCLRVLLDKDTTLQASVLPSHPPLAPSLASSLDLHSHPPLASPLSSSLGLAPSHPPLTSPLIPLGLAPSHPPLTSPLILPWPRSLAGRAGRGWAAAARGGAAQGQGQRRGSHTPARRPRRVLRRDGRTGQEVTRSFDAMAAQAKKWRVLAQGHSSGAPSPLRLAAARDGEDGRAAKAAHRGASGALTAAPRELACG